MDEFEIAFSDMAYARLQEEGQELLDHMVGFEVVESDETQSRAVGIFVFKVGDLVIYAPEFYVNGETKPSILMYLPKQDVFLPLSKETVRDLLKGDTASFGTSVPKNTPQRYSEPSLEELITPPRTGRYVAAEWAPSVTVGEPLESNVLMKAASVASYPILKLFLDNEELRNIAHNFGTLEQVMKVATEQQKQQKVAAAPQVQVPAILLEKHAAFTAKMREGTTIDKQRAIRDGFIVCASDSTETQLYNTEYTQTFQNPNKSGLYLTIAADGELVPVVIFMAPKALDTPHSIPEALVYDPSTQKYTEKPANEIWVQNTYENDDYSSLFEKALAVDSAQVGKSYFLAAPSAFIRTSGRASEVFKVAQKVKVKDSFFLTVEPNYRPEPCNIAINRMGHPNQYSSFWGPPRGQTSEAAYTSRNATQVEYERLKLYPTGIKGDELHQTGTGLAVPLSYVLFPVNETESLELGDTGTLQHAIRYGKQFQPLQLRTDGAEYFASMDKAPWKTFSKKAALAEYMVAVGFHTASINRLLDDVSHYNRCAYLVKTSALDPRLIPDSTGMASYVQYPEEEYHLMDPSATTSGPPLERMLNDMYLGPQGIPAMSSTASQIGQSLAQLGDKDLFEHGTLAALAQTNDILGEFNSSVPLINKLLDKLGRIIYLFWYRDTDVKKLFQLQDYLKLEDKLVQTFKSLGEIKLEFRQKASFTDAEAGEDEIF